MTPNVDLPLGCGKNALRPAMSGLLDRPAAPVALAVAGVVVALVAQIALAFLGFGAGLAIHDAVAQTTATFSLTLSGPTTAQPGDELVYILRHSYSKTVPPRQVLYFFDIPQGTTFVSVSDTSGTDFAGALVGRESFAPGAPEFAARAVGQPNVQLTFIPSASDGQATIRVKIASGASGSIQAHAGFGATDMGTSNEVVTSIRSASLPSTGAWDSRASRAG